MALRAVAEMPMAVRRSIVLTERASLYATLIGLPGRHVIPVFRVTMPSQTVQKPGSSGVSGSSAETHPMNATFFGTKLPGWVWRSHPIEYQSAWKEKYCTPLGR
eukprot:1149127-Pelagomonas_calceolata.AAC.6